MKFSSFLRVPLATLTLIGASHMLRPVAQAHDNPEHTATQALEQKAALLESTLPLAVGTIAVLGIAAGSYYVRKKRSV